MASSKPLQGSELIDCARANSTKGVEVAAQRCGYGSDLAVFEQQLQQAGEAIGVEINSFEDLIVSSPSEEEVQGIVIAPESSSQF